jgi:hypothetical protein
MSIIEVIQLNCKNDSAHRVSDSLDNLCYVDVVR